MKKINRFTLSAILLPINIGAVLILFIFIIDIPACVPREYKSLPQSPERFSFGGYKIPEAAEKMKVPFAVIIVEPAYKEKIDPAFRPVIKSFSSHIGIGLEEILVAKGVNTKGPYSTLDEITWPDKKGANLTLTETVFIQIEDKGQVSLVRERYDTGKKFPATYLVETRRMAVEIWFTYEMREPLSAEKMWLKKLELGTFEEDYMIGKEVASPQRRKTETLGYFDTKKEVFAGILNKVYPQIMQAAWVYIHPDELLVLDKKADEIRSKKVYEYSPR